MVSGGSGVILNLDTGAVNLGGTQGFTLTGGGTMLWGSLNNPISGKININDGTLQLATVSGSEANGMFNDATVRTFNIASNGQGFRTAMGGDATFTILGSESGSTISSNVRLTKGGGTEATTGPTVMFTVDAGSTLDVTGSFDLRDNYGNQALTKAGDGTMVLRGVNSYPGATMVNAGKLIVNGSIASSSGPRPQGRDQQMLSNHAERFP